MGSLVPSLFLFGGSILSYKFRLYITEECRLKSRPLQYTGSEIV